MSKFVNSVRGLQFIFKHYFGHWKVIFRKNKQTNKSDLKRAKKSQSVVFVASALTVFTLQKFLKRTNKRSKVRQTKFYFCLESTQHQFQIIKRTSFIETDRSRHILNHGASSFVLKNVFVDFLMTR